MHRLSKIAVSISAVAVVLYLGICAALFISQRSLIYFPQPRTNQSASTLLSIPVENSTFNVSVREKPGPKALIYFGGNAEDVSLDMPDLSATFPDRAIYLLHYPGYGGSPGTPTEKGIIADALALFDRVHSQHQNVLVIGRSLGTGVAVQLASSRPIERLVLVTPYDSLTDPAAENYPCFPVRWLLKDKFDSWRYAPTVTVPTKIIAAGQDEVIPRASTERLRTRFTKAAVSYVVVPGAGHNTISDDPAYLSLLKSQ
jgi:pimeloyl-ACP methyl ester carboxylesterase